MADFEELVRQDVEEKAADELFRFERAGFLAAGAKDDAIFRNGDQPRGGDRNTMGITTEIVDDLLRSAQRLLGEDDPVLFFCLANQLTGLVLGEINFAGFAELDEAVEEFAAEQPREGGDGKEEVLVGDADPG